MFVKDIFVKNIERDIQSVVKVFDNKENEFVEIEEYVVTEEIFSFIKKFVDGYRNTILNKNDGIGFWISGFFGSGKSHFLKILYYILKNINLNVLIKNNPCLKNIENDLFEISKISKDVILFNIDSKNRKNDSILDIFVNQFNFMRGYSKEYGFICEFEEQLVKEDLFYSFKAQFLRLSNHIWEDVRDEFYFYKDDVVKALSVVKNFDEERSEKYFSDVEKNYKMNIEKFSQKVKDYIDEKGENHNVVFMIDEVSQFISGDVNKILNLQTIVEELSNKCNGKAFVIVTSHVDILSMTNDKKYDFSKIQGRFSNKFYLSSVNIDEVLGKRLLLKKDSSIERLRKVYEDREFFIKNNLKFDLISDFDASSMDKDEFVFTYPFLSYQINLLRDVIYFMTKNNVISDDVSKGERSLINFFQKILIDFKDFDLNNVVPFYMFYEPISDYIDHNHQYIFSILKDYKILNSFDINILKILFLIKYVPNIVPIIDTISSLMILDLREKGNIKRDINDSLKKLVNEGFVNNDGDKFYFLSKVERDINYKIIRTSIEVNEIKEFLCDEIFNKLWSISKIKYQNKVSFSINKILDEINYKTSSKNLIGVKILTTNYDENFNIDSIRIISSIENNVIVYLNDDKNLVEEINLYLKLEKFLKYNKTNFKDKFNEILENKEIEIKNRLDRIRVLICDSIKNSYVFVNGEKLNTNFSDAKDIFKNSINQLIFCRFNKFTYVNRCVSSFGELIDIFNDEDKLNENVRLNSLFLNELMNFINESNILKFSEIIFHFRNIPYGFNKVDIVFGILYLLKIGKVLCNFNFDEIISMINTKSFENKIEIKRINDISQKDFNFYKRMFSEMFNKKYLFNNFQDFLNECKNDLENLKLKVLDIKVILNKNELYPGKVIVEKLDRIIDDLISSDSNKFGEILNNNEDIIENFEKFEVIYNFYKSVQFDIFNKGIKIFEIFKRDKNFIEDEKLLEIYLSVEKILKSETPYRNISKLKVYINDFLNLHREMIEVNLKYVIDFIDKEIMGFVSLDLIGELKEKLQKCNSLFDIYGVKMEAIFLKDKILKLKD